MSSSKTAKSGQTAEAKSDQTDEASNQTAEAKSNQTTEAESNQTAEAEFRVQSLFQSKHDKLTRKALTEPLPANDGTKPLPT